MLAKSLVCRIVLGMALIRIEDNYGDDADDEDDGGDDYDDGDDDDDDVMIMLMMRYGDGDGADGTL